MATYEEVKTKVAKKLQDDKQYLKHCLENKAPQGDLLHWKSNWWASEDTVITVARILQRYSQLTSASETIDYFESPYKFEAEMRFIIEEM